MGKITVAQIDSSIGRIKQNAEKIKNAIIQARENHSDWIIFPQYAITGFPVKNLLCRNKYLHTELKSEINEISKLSNDINILLCTVETDGNTTPLLISNQKTEKVSSVFIENEKYEIITGDIIEQPKTSNGNIIHLCASSSRNGKEYLKNKAFSDYAQKNNANYIFVNTVGYGDNLVFDGNSRIYDKKGNITARAKSFEEDLLFVDHLKGRIEPLPVDCEAALTEEFSFNYKNDLDRLYKELICGIRGYFYKNGFNKAVLGLSGGLDSTICAVLLTDALGKENVVGVSMPTKISSQGSKDDAKELAKNLGITYIEAPIAQEVELFKNELETIYTKIPSDNKYRKSTTLENVQARTRATLLWSISNEYKGMLPISTSDKSEGYIGYATTNGDMSGGFAPIADVTKTKLFALGAYMNKFRTQKNDIPQNVLEKPPGAELKFDKEKGRTITAEEDNMPYPFLDEIIWNIEHFGLGEKELLNKEFLYEKSHNISKEQKSEWIKKFFPKYAAAVFKWHLMPPGIITEEFTINQSEYYQPIV